MEILLYLESKSVFSSKNSGFFSWHGWWFQKPKSSSENMLNCLCWKQIENNMFALLNNFETFIFLSQRTFFTEALTQMQVCFLTKNSHIKAGALYAVRWMDVFQVNFIRLSWNHVLLIQSVGCYSYYWDIVQKERERKLVETKFVVAACLLWAQNILGEMKKSSLPIANSV